MLKICEQCGEGFTSKKDKTRFCSFECGKISSIALVRKQGENKFRDNFSTRFKDKFEYVYGYVNSGSIVIVKCLSCGELLSRSAQIARKNKQLTCSNCIKIKNSTAIEQKMMIKNELNRIREEERIKSITKIKKCKQCSSEYSTTKNIEGFCCAKCLRRYKNNRRDLVRRHRLRENGKVDYTVTLDKLIKRDKGKCKMCGEMVDVNDYTVNEGGVFIASDRYPSVACINPVSNGGTHTWDNIQLAHRNCNTTKGNRAVYSDSGGQLTLAI